MKLNKHLSLYDDSNNYLSIESLEFNTPDKLNNKYLSKTNTDVFFILPKINHKNHLTIDKENNQFILNIENYDDIVSFFYKMDEQILNACFLNSETWFNKKITQKVLEASLKTSVTKDFKLILKIEDELLSKIDDDCTIVVRLNGIEFYKSNFICNYQIHKVLNNNIESVSRIDFISYIENRKESSRYSVVNDLVETNEDIINTCIDSDDLTLKTIVDEDKSDKIVTQTPEENSSIRSETDTNIIDQGEDTNSIYNIDNLQNIGTNEEDKVSKKEQEIINLFESAEKASVNAEELKLEAIKTANDYRNR